MIRAAQGVPKPSGAAPAGDPLSAVLTLIIALTALKRKWRRPPAA